ncbi:hypothetical protein JOC94_000954 [Bacillus thermophilus]|uniref:Methionine/alanine importer small subunit n=1 Tax=Siminovitchia thermophila TaxID=1245522 RepID=A0ABS2R320_9BACI|nr:hypothetical protein [Siminovitchia thermophila]
MSGSAIAMMFIGAIIIWGGFAASVGVAISKSKKQ